MAPISDQLLFTWGRSSPTLDRETQWICKLCACSSFRGMGSIILQRTRGSNQSTSKVNPEILKRLLRLHKYPPI
ncbi:unnamed protein product [Sphenostylis stenocarpa]|uniref:Uncharacterized protein n=1 Tax=Sphenostylis stenocarpa TaxID=92480 RepID=A0AA86RXC1_9FABA|nr:unnamed protein product [Sphenostylis stenocarpa]